LIVIAEKRIWKQGFIQIFDKNIPLLKIKNTNFERIKASDPITQGVYDGFIYELSSKSFPTLSVDFSYRPEGDFNE